MYILQVQCAVLISCQYTYGISKLGGSVKFPAIDCNICSRGSQNVQLQPNGKGRQASTSAGGDKRPTQRLSSNGASPKPFEAALAPLSVRCQLSLLLCSGAPCFESCGHKVFGLANERGRAVFHHALEAMNARDPSFMRPGHCAASGPCARSTRRRCRRRRTRRRRTRRRRTLRRWRIAAW